jgi:hypothetical protein
MTPDEIIEELAELDEAILTADGFDAALLGYVQVFSRIVALYDREKCIAILMERDEMSLEDAEEYFDFNVVGGYHGEKTPAFATILSVTE